MGSILRAECSCGYRSGELPAGAGRLSGGAGCMFPALCRSCRMVVSVQRDLDGAKCPRCGGEVAFYDSPALQARHDPPQTPTCVFRWPLADGSYAQLPATRYYCPKCEQLAMTFAVVGCLD